MKNLFKLAVFFCLTLFSTASIAQLGIKLSHTRPTGDAGAILKTSFSPEIVFIPDLEANWRGRCGISYASFKPRADRFYGYERYGSGNDYVISELYTVVNHYRTFTFNGGFDWTFRGGGELFVPYLGMDVVLAYTSFSYSTFKSLMNSWEDENDLMLFSIGLRPRIGCEYFLGRMTTFFEVSTGFRYGPDSGYFLSNDFGLGIRF